MGEIRVVGAGAKQVEHSDNVEGKNGGRHTAAVQKGRETAVEEDTGHRGERLGQGWKADYLNHRLHK